jgi:hypothetical protein
MAIDLYNVNAVVRKTNFDTQSQEIVFSADGFIYPSKDGAIVPWPIGPSSSEYPMYKRLHTLIFDGLRVNPSLVLLEPGDEMTLTALNDDALLFEGIWRVEIDSAISTGGDFNDIDNVEISLLKI